MTAEPIASPTVEDAHVLSVHPHRFRTRFLVAFAIGLLAVLGVGVGALYAYDQQHQGRILPGVRVASVNLSGLTPAEASARLHEAYDQYASGKVVLVSSFVPLAAGLFWPKANTRGAYAAIAAGLATWIALEIAAPEGLFPPALAGLAASIAGMIAGSLLPLRPSIPRP